MIPEEVGNPGLSLPAVLASVAVTSFVAASSVYIAVVLSALPWPIVLSVVLSYSLLKAIRRKPSIHEVNVAQAGGSVGGLIAASVVFTIPAFYHLRDLFGADVRPPTFAQLVAVVMVASLLGVFLSLPVRRFTIDEQNLPYPSGYVGAEVLKAAYERGLRGRIVLISGLLAAIYAALSSLIMPPGGIRLSLELAGLVFVLGIYPLLVAFGTGYVIGREASLSWLLGAVAGWVILAPLLQALGYSSWHVAVMNAGMGVVFGAGLAFLFLQALPKSSRAYAAYLRLQGPAYFKAPLILSIASIPVLIAVGVNPFASVLAVLGSWVMSAIAGKMTGETNIDPLEQFGLMVGLVTLHGLAALGVSASLSDALLVTCFVAASSALAGDIGHDFKSAQVIGTRPRDIAYVDAVASIVGTLIAVAAFSVILRAYYSAIVSLETPLAMQSKLVAGALYGFPYPGVFLAGVAGGFIAESVVLLRRRSSWWFRAMPFGVGMFLGFGLAIPIAVGGLLRQVAKKKGRSVEDTGLLVVAGLMGGESFTGFSLGLAAVLGAPMLPSAILVSSLALVLLTYTVARSHHPKRKGGGA